MPLLNATTRAAPLASRTEESPRPLLELNSLGLVRNGKWLFRNLAATLEAGELVAVTGPSGAGKSSLLSGLGGDLGFDEGTLEGIGAASSARPAWVYQDLRLVPQATLLANVLMARLNRHPWWRTLWSFPSEERRAALEQLAEFDLAPLALRPTRHVSGGEQQRTAVARALFARAPILLADEPVANLNEALANRVLGRLRTEARHNGALVLCVLHHEEQVRQFAGMALRLGSEWPNGWCLEKIQ